eukprot:10402135-Karenia_brevis.AAC.1
MRVGGGRGQKILAKASPSSSPCPIIPHLSQHIPSPIDSGPTNPNLKGKFSPGGNGLGKLAVCR